MNLSSCLPVYYSNSKIALEFNILNKDSFNKNYWQSEKYNIKMIYSYRENLNEINYWDTLVKFISMSESCTLYPYICPGNVITVGCGIALKNFDSKIWRPLAVNAFESIGIKLNEMSHILLDHVKTKTPIISEDESNHLLKFILNYNQSLLQNICPFFSNLPLNIQISIHSLFYNSPSLVYGELLESLNEFYKNNNHDSLESILYIIGRCSNLGAPYDGKQATISYWEGIQYRRYREMIMCSNNFIDEKYWNSLYLDLF